METQRSGMIKGIAVSPGIARGTAYVVDEASLLAIPRRGIAENEVSAELAKFEAAVREAEQHLEALRKDVAEKIGEHEAQIFDTQVMLLHDPNFLADVTSRCTGERVNIEAAVAEVVEGFSKMFAAVEDVYLRERAGDIRDVGRRVLDILLKQHRDDIFNFPEGVIVVATELFPSTTARMNLRTVRGVVTERGGRTSHASILTRSLGIPGVIGIKDATERIKTGDALIVDGLAGTVYLNPQRAVVTEYDALEAHFKAYQDALKDVVELPAETRDGVRIRLCANIGKLGDAEAAFLFRADGIGLYRTEFNFLVRDHVPTDEEHYDIYRRVAERLAPREVIIRVLDIGSDKVLSYFPLPQEPNPSLGRRGTRLLLKHPELLKPQLRAILRLSATHPVAILFPMINCVAEMAEAKAIVESTKQALKAEGQSFNADIRVGAMIEVPSAAILARQIARLVDFFSIGTNDLIQYVLTADRLSEEMAGYYEPLHPAVLHTIKSVVDAARAEGRDVAVCGEMAGNPAYTALLLGLGVRNLSVTPGEILEVKKMIRSISIAAAEQLATRVLGFATPQEIKDCLNAAVL